jgi:predicted transcriptional regulator
MNAQRRRDRISIGMGILSSISQGKEHPTNIMNHANTSWQISKPFLQYFTAKGLISWTIEEKTPFRRLYFLTSKGRSALESYRDLQNLLGLHSSEVWR